MSDAYVWCMFFAALSSFKTHPGYLREGADTFSLEQAAAMADLMMVHYLQRKDRFVVLRPGNDFMGSN